MPFKCMFSNLYSYFILLSMICTNRHFPQFISGNTEWQGISVLPSHVYSNRSLLRVYCQASLMVQWWRIHLPMQETRIQSLTREDPPSCGVTKLMHHNYWSLHSGTQELQLPSPCATAAEACMPRARAARQETPLQWPAHPPQPESGPGSPRYRRAHAATKTQHSQK